MTSRGGMVLETLGTNGPWIVFSYRLPSEPSTLRVRAWRILRRIGALSLQQSACVAPRTPEVIRKLEQLKQLIDDGGGETLWLDVEQFAEETRVNLIQRLNRDRSDEYKSFIDACLELKFEPPIEECESSLKRLQKWLRKLHARDYFDCIIAADAELTMARVEEQFASWADSQK